MASQRNPDSGAWVAMAAGMSMLAFHVGSKAVRDALFITSFSVTALPVMIMAASLFSFACVLLNGRLMTKLTPARLVPASFFLSSVVMVGVWLELNQIPKVASVVLYLHIVGIGSILTSGFWSMVNETFDPRTARRHVGRIAGASTLGGILGGVIAERVGAHFSITAMLPALAAYHAACGVLLLVLARRTAPSKEDRSSARDGEAAADISVFRILKDALYLRTLAALVILGTISAAMIDYVFKAQAANTYGGGEPLMRFFALFYSAAGVLTFLVQAALSRLSIEKLGLAKTVGTLPVAVSFGGVLALIYPGVASATLARAIEAVFRGSLFRAGYELFYTPMPPVEKRAAKSVVDVGFDRLGDAVGSGLVRLMLPLGPAVALPAILTGAIIVALAGLWVASQLRGAYISVLERGLLQRGEGLELPNQPDPMALSGVLESVPGADFRRARPGAADSDSSLIFPSKPGRIISKRPDLRPGSESAPAVSPISSSGLADPVLQRLAILRSGDPARIRQILQSGEPLEAPLIHQVIQLLAWDIVYHDAIRALRKVVEKHTGQLIDTLTEPDSDFVIRRRIPRVLTACRSQLAAAGLLLGLRDRRFEVRYQCGRALSVLLERNPALRVAPADVFSAVHLETAAGKTVWESHRLLDRTEEKDLVPSVDDFLRDRANRSMEHVFTLLSLVLPKEPLRVAFHGLHTDDAHLRGTAIEYLESVLPPDLRVKLMPLLDAESVPRRKESRSSELILEDLMQSNQSIMINLAELRKKAEPPPGGKEPA